MKQNLKLMIYLYLMVYYVLLAVYCMEYPKLLKINDAARSELLVQFFCHMLMFVASVSIFVLHCRSDSFYFMMGEYSGALVLLDSIGILTGLGGMVILVREYKNPKKCRL